MSVGLEVKPASLIWQSSLVIVVFVVFDGFKNVNDFLTVKARKLLAPIVDFSLVHSEKDENEDSEGCECGSDVTESFLLEFVHLSFAYRIIIAYFLGFVNPGCATF